MISILTILLSIHFILLENVVSTVI